MKQTKTIKTKQREKKNKNKKSSWELKFFLVIDEQVNVNALDEGDINIGNVCLCEAD